MVVGGGPAGATAACFLADRRWRVGLVDPLGVGGRLINVDALTDEIGLPTGTAGWDLAASLGEQVMAAGVEIIFGRLEGLHRHPDGAAEEAVGVTGVDGATGAAAESSPAGLNALWRLQIEAATYHANTVLIATGSRPVPLPGDEQGALLGRGVSYCAVCDGGLFAGRRVAVIGGGDIALAEAMTLAAQAREVVLLFPQTVAPGAASRLEALQARPNVSFLSGATLLEVARLADAAPPGSSFQLRYLDRRDGNHKHLAVDGVFGAHQEQPNGEALSGLVGVDSHGFVITDDGFACPGWPGLFAAGEVRRGAAPYVTAARGEGLAAAAAMHALLQSQLRRLGDR